MAISRTIELLNRSKLAWEAVRDKLDSLGKDVEHVPVEDYPSLITAGDEVNLQQKTINIINNGTQSIVPDAEYDGLSQVNLNINVPSSIPFGSFINIDHISTDFEYTYPATKIKRGNLVIGKNSNDDDGYYLQPIPVDDPAYYTDNTFNIMIFMGHNSLGNEYKNAVYYAIVDSSENISFVKVGNTNVNRANATRIIPNIISDGLSDHFYYIGTDNKIYKVTLTFSEVNGLRVPTSLVDEDTGKSRLSSYDDGVSYFAIDDIIFCQSRSTNNDGFFRCDLTASSEVWQKLGNSLSQVVNTPTVTRLSLEDSGTQYFVVYWMLIDGTLEKLKINQSNTESVTFSNISFGSDKMYINSYPNRRYNLITGNNTLYAILNGSNDSHVNIDTLDLDSDTYENIVVNGECNRLGLLFRLGNKLYQVQFLYGTDTYDIAILAYDQTIYKIYVPEDANVKAYQNNLTKLDDQVILDNKNYDTYSMESQDYVCVYDSENVYFANIIDDKVLLIKEAVLYTKDDTITVNSDTLYTVTYPFIIKHS